MQRRQDGTPLEDKVGGMLGAGAAFGGVPPGEDGIDGADGAQGAPGPAGTTGATGATGAKLLVYENEGSSTSAVPAFLDQYPFAALDLTEKDTVEIIAEFEGVGGGAVTVIDFYQVTDNVSLTGTPNGLLNGALAINQAFAAEMLIERLFSSPQLLTANGLSNHGPSLVGLPFLSVATDWEAAWDIGLQFSGIPAGGTLFWRWRVYIIKGEGLYVAGEAGPAGATGPMGPPGSDGADGLNGADGPPGPSGPAGGAGAIGPAGVMGPPGSDGIDGVDGADGAPGPMGAPGATGPTGATGLAGASVPGPPGDDGQVGEPGPPGPQGAAGPTGATGATGTAGPMGPPGADGEEGPEGPRGADGARGPTGPAGGAGAPTITDLVKDLGAARRSGTFDITGLAGLTAGKVVTIVQTAAQVASKGNARDEFEMDAVQATGYVVDAATIRVYWWAPNVVVGDVAFGYAVNG